MVIQESSMVNGWFRTFAIQGQDFEYSVNGMTLFGGPQDLDYFENVATTSNSVIAIMMPDYYYNNSGTPTLEFARSQIRGFFGPGVTNEKFCYSTTPVNPLTGYFADSSLSPQISYIGSSIYDPANIYLIGGYASLAGCVNNYSSDMILNPTAYPQSVNQRSAFPIQQEFNFPTPSGTFSLTSWAVLPGLGALISSYNLYGISQMALEYLSTDDHDGVDCDELEAAALSYPSEIVLGGTTAVSGTTITGSTAGMPAGAAYVLCPVTNYDIPGTILYQ
jgi:hypothetical protein